jgi:carboxylesterase
MTPLSNQPFITHGDRGHMCLFLHGLGGGVYEMQPLAQHLQRQGYSTCGILYPGHDQPAPKMPASRWQDWYQQVEETYDTLAETYDTVSLLGFSTGCILALYLALSKSADPIKSLILMAPYLRIRRYPFVPFPPEFLVYSLGYLLPNLPRLSLPIKDKEMRKSAKEAAFFQTFNLNAVRSANDLIQKLKPFVSQVNAPTLIFQSQADSVVDPPGAQWLFDELGSPQKSLEWLTQSDHIISLDVEREFVFQCTATFLNALS